MKGQGKTGQGSVFLGFARQDIQVTVRQNWKARRSSERHEEGEGGR